MASYPELVSQLHNAAVDQGLSIYTLVFRIADEGNGLKEALETKFTNFQFILDYAHFKQHLYQAVEAMKLERKWRSIWLNCTQNLIEGGLVKTIKQLLVASNKIIISESTFDDPSIGDFAFNSQNGELSFRGQVLAEFSAGSNFNLNNDLEITRL